MKIISAFLLGVLIAGSHLCSGQADTVTKEAQVRPVVFKRPTPKEPLYVLQAGDQTIMFDPLINEQLNRDALDKEAIVSVTVLKDDQAIEKYGKRGANKVIILVFKDTYILSKEALLKVKSDQ